MIAELIVDPVQKCGCDYDTSNNKIKFVVNTFEPYYMDYRILDLKGHSINKLLNEVERRKQLEMYINKWRKL